MATSDVYSSSLKFKRLTEHKNPKEDPLYPMLSVLCSKNDKNTLIMLDKYDHKKERWHGVSAFVPSLIPLAVFLCVKWSNSFVHTFLILALFAAAVFIHQYKYKKSISKDKYSPCIIVFSAVALLAVFIVIRFTDLTIRGSEKAFVVIYIWIVFLLYLVKLLFDVKEAKKYNQEVERHFGVIDSIKKALNDRAVLYEEMEKSACGANAVEDRHYWWNHLYCKNLSDEKIFTPYHTDDVKYDTFINHKGNRVSTEKKIDITMRLMLNELGEREKDLALQKIAGSGGTVLPALNDRFDANKMYAIVVRKVTETFTTVTSEERELVTPTEQDIAGYRNDVNDKYDFQERMINSNTLTNEENRYYSQRNGADSETVYNWDRKIAEGEILRDNAVRRKIEKNTYENITESVDTDSDRKEEQKIIGFVQGGVFCFYEAEIKKVDSLMRNRALSLYVKYNPETIEIFRENPFMGYDSESEAQIASMIAHSGGVWD